MHTSTVFLVILIICMFAFILMFCGALRFLLFVLIVIITPFIYRIYSDNKILSNIKYCEVNQKLIATIPYDSYKISNEESDTFYFFNLPNNRIALNVDKNDLDEVLSRFDKNVEVKDSNYTLVKENKLIKLNKNSLYKIDDNKFKLKENFKLENKKLKNTIQMYLIETKPEEPKNKHVNDVIKREGLNKSSFEMYYVVY